MSQIINPSGASGGGPAVPTVVVADAGGTADAITLTPQSPEAAGASDGPSLRAAPTDSAGASDALATIDATLTQSDASGASDVLPLRVQETAQAASGTPDTDSWGDGWVDRLLANSGTHQNNAGGVNRFAQVTVLTELTAFLEINFGGAAARGTPRLVSFANGAGVSTLTFSVTWPVVALNLDATVRVDFRTQAARPFVESTFTSNSIGADFASGAPFTQRTFVFPQDGTVRTHIVTLAASEVAQILNGNWLLVQFTVPALTVGTPFILHGRNFGDATTPQLDFFCQR